MQISPFKFSYDDAEHAYKTEEKALAIVALRNEGRMFRRSMKAEVCTEGIAVTEYGQSLGLILADDDELFFKDLEDLVSSSDPEFAFLKHYEMHPILKNDRLFLKLKTYQDKYRFKADIAMDPKKPEKSTISRGDLLDVEIEIKMYLNLAEKKAGFILDLLRLKTEKPQPIKKRKT